jgi:sugar phosphate permease
MAETAVKKDSIFNLGTKGWGVTLAGVAFMYCWMGILIQGSNYWLTFLESDYGWSRTSIAGATTAAGLISPLGILLWGVVVKKIGAKNLSALTLIASGLSLLVFPAFMSVASMWIATILYLFFAVGHSVIGVSQLGADWFPHKKGVYMGFVTVGATLQAAFAALILTALVPTIGIMNTMLIFCGIQVVMGVLVFAFIKDTPEQVGAFPDNDKSMTREQVQKEFEEMEEYKKHSPWTVKRLLVCPAVWTIGLGLGIVQMAGNGFISQMVPAFMDYGHDVMFGVTILSTAWPIGLAGHVVVGIIDQKWGTKNTTILVSAMIGIAALIISFWGANTAAALIAAGFFLFGFSGVINVITSLSVTAFGRKDFGNAFPVISMIFQLVQYCGVTYVAFFAESFGYAKALLIVVGTVVVGLAILMFAPKQQVAPPKGVELNEDGTVKV